MRNAAKRWCFLFLICAVFAAAYFAVRVPLLHEPLGWEEGIFAELSVNRPAGPNYNMSGRVNGEKLYGFISHPAALYELLRAGGWAFQKALTPVYQDDALVTPRLRALYASYQLVFWMLLAGLVVFRHSTQTAWRLLLIFTVAFSPLAIKTSARLQTDSASGMLLCGTAAVLFLLAAKPDLKHAFQRLLLLGGGLVAGLGKQEWSFALLLALAFGLMYWRLRRRPLREAMAGGGWIAAGLAFGNLASYLYDPENYTRSIHFIRVFSNLSEVSPDSWRLERWLELMQIRLPYLVIAGMLLGLFVYFWGTGRQRRSFLSCVIALYGSFLFGGFMLTTHSHQLRYFAPGLAVVTVAVLAVFPDPLNRWGRRLILLTACSMLLMTVVFLRGFTPDRNPALEYINSGRYRPIPGTVLFVIDSAAWNKPEIDYLKNNVSYEAARRWLKNNYNKELVTFEEIQRQSMSLRPCERGVE